MNTVLHLRIRWTHPDRLPLLPPDGMTPGIADPRVLRGVYDALRRTPGITGVDLVSQGNAYSGGRPYYVVTVSSRRQTTEGTDLTINVAELDEGSIQFSLAWSQGGGIKVALVDVTTEII